MNWTRLDYATAIVGLLIAAALFPVLFKGLSGFWDDLTESGGWVYQSLSWGQCKVAFWLLIAAGGAYSARYNFPHWFPHFFQ
jgi:hypothetical protein